MPRVKYSEEYKRNAVSIVESGSAAAKVARDLNVSANQIYAWCKQYRNRPSEHGNATHNQDELTQVKKELAHAKMELDILKKAIGILTHTVG